MAIFDNATSITIGNKEVKSIKIGEATLYEKDDEENESNIVIPRGSVGFRLELYEDTTNTNYDVNSMYVFLTNNEHNYVSTPSGNGLHTISNVEDGTYTMTVRRSSNSNGPRITFVGDNNASVNQKSITVDENNNFWDIEIL